MSVGLVEVLNPDVGNLLAVGQDRETIVRLGLADLGAPEPPEHREIRLRLSGRDDRLGFERRDRVALHQVFFDLSVDAHTVFKASCSRRAL